VLMQKNHNTTDPSRHSMRMALATGWVGARCPCLPCTVSRWTCWDHSQQAVQSPLNKLSLHPH
jgi:hypothetical protein